MRNILITGGTGRIGLVLVKSLLKGDYAISIVTRDKAKAFDALSKYIGTQPNTINFIEQDLLEDSSTERILRQLDDNGICIEMLINNARSLDSLKSNEYNLSSRDDFARELLMQVILPYELTMKLSMSRHHTLKSVVNVGSQYGIVAPNSQLHGGDWSKVPIQYGASKAAVHHLTRELAVRLADRGVRVNCVAFGGVEGRVDETFKTRYASLVPIGRMLSDGDLAAPIEFLLGDGASAVTGHVLVADGGWTVW